MFGHDERAPRAARCELETICSTLLRAPLSDKNRAEPSQHCTCQNTQYTPDCGVVCRKRCNNNNYGQNELDRCADVVHPARVRRFGDPTVHCRRVGHRFNRATAACFRSSADPVVRIVPLAERLPATSQVAEDVVAGASRSTRPVEIASWVRASSGQPISVWGARVRTEDP